MNRSVILAFVSAFFLASAALSAVDFGDAGTREWFRDADTKKSFCVKLFSTDKFASLPDTGKQEVMGKTAEQLKQSGISKINFIKVIGASSKSLWKMNSSGKLVKLDSWLSSNPLSPEISYGESGSVFVYFGGQLGIGSPTTGAINFRLGTFLLKNKIDAALYGNMNYYSSGSFSGTNTEYGLIARYYLPLKNNLYLNLGGQYSSSGITSLIAGLSIRLTNKMIDTSVTSGRVSFGMSTFLE
jgi:hypothetical protein